VVDRDERDLVRGRAVDERVRDPDAQRVHRGRGRAVEAPLEALVALDAALDDVLRLALGPGQLDPVDAAVPRVHELHVVDEPAEEPAAAGRVRTDPVALEREVLLLSLRRRRRAAASVGAAGAVRRDTFGPRAAPREESRAEKRRERENTGAEHGRPPDARDGAY